MSQTLEEARAELSFLRYAKPYIDQRLDYLSRRVTQATGGGTSGGGSSSPPIDLSEYITIDELHEALAGLGGTVDVLGTAVPADSYHGAATLHALLDQLFGMLAAVAPNTFDTGRFDVSVFG